LSSHKLVNATAIAALGSALMGLALTAWLRWQAQSGSLVQLAGGVVIGVLVYGAVAWLTGVPELRAIVSRLQRKISRRA
jgi:pheromone shutdown protein TraB